MRPKRTVPAFELLAPYYDEYVSEIDYESWVAAYDEIARACLGRSVESVLDVGCGTGVSTRPWRQRARQIIGLEIERAMLIQAQALGGRGIEWVLGSADNLPFQDASFDLIQMSFSVINLFAIDQLCRIFGSVARCMGKKGLYAFDFVSAVRIDDKQDYIYTDYYRTGSIYIRSTRDGDIITQTYETHNSLSATLILYLHSRHRINELGKDAGLQLMSDLEVSTRTQQPWLRQSQVWMKQ